MSLPSRKGTLVKVAEKPVETQVLSPMLAEVVNKMMRSFVGSAICHFLSNLHPFDHKIFLARHGESTPARGSDLMLQKTPQLKPF